MLGEKNFSGKNRGCFSFKRVILTSIFTNRLYPWSKVSNFLFAKLIPNLKFKQALMITSITVPIVLIVIGCTFTTISGEFRKKQLIPTSEVYEQTMNSQHEILPPNRDTVSSEEGIVVNNDKDAPSLPMDLVLLSTSFSENQVATMSVKISKRKGYPADKFYAKDVTAEISLPEGLELIDGELIWKGNISGNQVIQFSVKVKAVNKGEWIVEARAYTYNFPPYDFLADSERFYVLVLDDRVLISEKKFPSNKLPEPEVGEKGK